MNTLTQSAIAVRPLMLTSIQLVSREPDQYFIENDGRLVFEDKTVKVLSREPLQRQAIHNVVKRAKGYRFESVRCELYVPSPYSFDTEF